jgi:hypothetical protein
MATCVGKRTTIWVGMALVVLATSAGLTPAPASAGSKGGTRYEANLGVHRGYRIRLSSAGKKVEVEIVKDNAYHHNGQAVAIYSVPGHASQHALHADFGPFGEIDARFDVTHRSGGERKEGRRCHYRSALTLRGRLRGTIRLPAQGDFLDFTAHSTPANFVHRYANDCPPAEEIVGVEPEEVEGEEEAGGVVTARASSSEEGFYKALLVSYGHDGPRRTFFEDESFYRPGEKGEPEESFLDGGYRERRGRVDVLEHAFFEAKAGFDLAEFDRGHIRATLSPPAPFSGSVTFTQEGKGAAPSLTGPLSISLPGVADVPLTGPNHLVDLCAKTAEFRCREEDPDD